MKSIKEHFSSLYTDSDVHNRKFWDTVKPFLNDKGSHGRENITLLEDGEIIREGYKISEIFNDHYVNIIENITGKKQEESQVTNINDMRRHEKEATLDSILERYISHPSIVSIKMHCPNDGPKFKFTKANPDDICQIIKGMKSHTSTGVDNIPSRLLMAADIIADTLTNLITATMLEESIFPDAEKRASVTPVFKRDDKLLKTNYIPISVLNVFSKVLERFLVNQMLSFIENVMSSLLSAYRSKYSTQHVLLRLIEQWRTFLDNDRLVGAVLMDLSKAFDCLPHDLLIAKLGAYGLDQNSLILLMSYLKDRRQSVKIKGVQSLFKLIKSGVPQGSILGPILFNIFINDLFYILQSDLHNFADDTISAVADTLSELITSLTLKSGLAIDWFKYNSMIVNPDKFKAIILSKSKYDTSGIPLTLGNQSITTQRSVTLLGVTIACALSFDKHVGDLCKTAASRLNALKRLRPFITSEKTRKCLVHAFVLAIALWCGTSQQSNNLIQWKRYMKGLLNL